MGGRGHGVGQWALGGAAVTEGEATPLGSPGTLQYVLLYFSPQQC